MEDDHQLEEEEYVYIGTKEEEMDAEGAIVDAETMCLQCDEKPRKVGALCQHCFDTIPF